MDPRDVGDVAAARLLAADWTGRQVQAVHGPADLTWHGVAEIVSAATGHPVRAEQIGDDDLRPGLTAAGLTERQVEAVVGMAAGLRDSEPEDPRTVLTTTPTTLAAWAHEHLRPLLTA
ncbi:hypothetical protein [Geodermatophilus amargosae]|uniref:hypothetical protein n=1 Tax=Geodermatophilus amargosae TaxID=1296565 RepID=UPI0034DE7F46